MKIKLTTDESGEIIIAGGATFNAAAVALIEEMNRQFGDQTFPPIFEKLGELARMVANEDEPRPLLVKHWEMSAPEENFSLEIVDNAEPATAADVHGEMLRALENSNAALKLAADYLRAFAIPKPLHHITAAIQFAENTIAGARGEK
jgi:hypothetical protein